MSDVIYCPHLEEGVNLVAYNRIPLAADGSQEPCLCDFCATVVRGWAIADASRRTTYFHMSEPHIVGGGHPEVFIHEMRKRGTLG
jgi:hypothetical protein